ncbi:hypothetical protein [Pseudosulfitobacter pseudonitzschiae]|uniref:hypothetical protein n=1 Tax=Pseudosulfitobacter pseudonitzschiae TaxID=1402135 RepID=UPI001E2DA4C3|nr:hypothetical protein [Pseudosulfitobacter pseudonitzschiae]MCD2311937.1 hypothetical protein [Pseudosulfitobacter pseudonitzschiae]
MRTYSLIFLGLLVTACNTPGPHFRGLPATRVTVDGSTFDVRVRDRLAEALRVNPEYAPRFGPIRDRAGVAMEQVSGCKVTEVRGDQALATGLLDCGDGPPKQPIQADGHNVCYTVRTMGPLRDYRCDPV